MKKHHTLKNFYFPLEFIYERFLCEKKKKKKKKRKQNDMNNLIELWIVIACIAIYNSSSNELSDCIK